MTFIPFHRTKLHSTKPLLHTRKHLTYQYQYTLHYKPTMTAERKNRQRNNILWYNPSFSKNVSTNIGLKFLSLIDKHFPMDHSLQKIFNCNTIKISYSAVWMTPKRSLTTITGASYTRLTYLTWKTTKTAWEPTKHATADKRTIACSTVTAFNLHWFIKPLSHGTTTTLLKHTLDSTLKQYRNHIASFRHAKHKNSTELSKHIWALKNDNTDYFISWRVFSSSSPNSSSSKRCNLCLTEKFQIICLPDLSSLNKHNKLGSSC